MATEEIIVSQSAERELRLWRPPEQILAEAHQAAKALQQVLAGKKKPVMFNGEQYLEYEDWQVLGQFFRYCVEVESVEYVEFGSTQGFKATASLKNEDTGAVISRAASMCLNNEENWGMVSEYEWKEVLDPEGKRIWDPLAFKGQGAYRKEKVCIGQKPKPMFQIMSMAQTRACAKAFRNKLSWVVVLAGYKPTPWEETGGRQDPAPETSNAAEKDRKKSAKSTAGSAKCKECGAEGGHLPKCSFRAENQGKGNSAAPAQEKTAAKENKQPNEKQAAARASDTEEPKATKQTIRGVMLVTSAAMGKSKAGNNLLKISGEDGKGSPGTVYVWSDHLQEALGVWSEDRKQFAPGCIGKKCVFEVLKTETGDKSYLSVEHIIQVGDVQFVDDKPVAEQSQLDMNEPEKSEPW